MKRFFSLVKFSHSIFALPFALAGFFLATLNFQNSLDYSLLLLVIGCMVFARNAAMAFNRFLDRDIDLKNARTASREIPAGMVSPKLALTFVIINCLAFITCTYFINELCFFLSPVALAVILGYSYTKRFTALCHLVLGVGLALAPIGAFLAVQGEFHWMAIILGFVVLFWVSGFDIIYALQDESFDREHGLHSIPEALGKSRALMLSRFLHFLSMALLVVLGWYGEMGMYYWIGSIAFVGFLFFQQSLIKTTDLSKINLAFFTSNGIASIFFASFFILDLYQNSQTGA